MKTEALPIWLKAVRVSGVILGLFFIFAAIAADSLASDAEPPPSTAQLLAQRCFFAIAALPLVVRWRGIHSHLVRRILLILLAGDALYFTYSSASSVVWAFQYGERGQIVPFILSGICITVILFAQFPAVSLLTNER